MCAGVQNVSRPIEICHEISQYPPKVSEVTAAARHHTYQGIAATWSRVEAPFRGTGFTSDCDWKGGVFHKHLECSALRFPLHYDIGVQRINDNLWRRRETAGSAR